jgi:hypothetical protein
MGADETINIPNAVKNILNQGEQVIAVVTQSRVKSLITPDSIVVTDHRIIRYSPSALGLHKDIETYLYEDMANFAVQKGILFATMTIRQKMMSDDLVIENLPKGQMDTISKAVNEAIRRARNPASISYSAASTPTEDPIKLLKVRFAKGEITKEQFEEMKKLME